MNRPKNYVHYLYLKIRVCLIGMFFLTRTMHCLFVEDQSFIQMNCDIYCQGDIMHYIQMSRIFNDSKYFVDMKMKSKPIEIKNNFKNLLNVTKNKPNKHELNVFIKHNFEEPEVAFSDWTPDDWTSIPSFVDDIYDIPLKNWIIELNLIWKKLGRKFNDDVKINNDLYSYIFVPHPFIVPGGRFTEFYYWDSYWIIEGLILSEMYETAQKMILNFLSMVDQIGYVPNGGRKYYLGRSQLPLLIPMCLLYWKATNNVTFLENSVALLEKEFNFWVKHRSISIEKNGLQFSVFQYKGSLNTANDLRVERRPESYYEDTSLAQGLNESEKSQFYSAIKSAAESGWDFSSRWLGGNGSKSLNLLTIDTEAVVPVCLNSIMGYNANILSSFFLILKNNDKSIYYANFASNIDKTMSRLFWNDELGTWLDYNIKTKASNPSFYLSNLMPLWTQSYGTEHDKSYIIDRVLNYIYRENITSYPGGVPTSLINSSQQWDFPNAWPPLQYFLVLGLEKAKVIDSRAGDLALDIAKKWILNCYSAYRSSNSLMFEKYDVTKFGTPGSGGEYVTQEGFGWTNGVAIKFMSVYRHQIRTYYAYDPLPVTIGLIATLISILSIASYTCRFNRAKVYKRLLKPDNMAFELVEEGENFV